jgi:hypothetical protein
MDITWVNVVDTAVKIGLGSLITAISGYLILGKNQSHDDQKENKNQFFKLQEEKKSKYVAFLSQSQGLVQSHLFTSCTADTGEYKSYLHAFNEVQIISPDEIRLAAHNLLTSVNEFIVINKNGLERDLGKALREAVDKNLGFFQKMAQVEVTKSYEKT